MCIRDSYLSGQNELDDVICETGIENLNIIFAGPTTPNPTELIGNSYFEEMIKTLREQYDYIIIDAPPLGSVIDAAIITKVCDGTILVVENNVISRRFAQDVKKQIEITGCKILGVIINKYDIYRKGKYKSYYLSLIHILSAIYANIETGVNEGYIVKQGAPEDDLDTENEIEITEVSPEQRRQGINDVSEINKVTPAPGSITYSEEGKAQIYNNDGDVIVSLNGILKNTGLSDRAVNICVLTFAFVFICIALFTVVFIASERRKYNES